MKTLARITAFASAALAACARTPEPAPTASAPLHSTALTVDVAALLPARSLGPRADAAGHVTLVRWWTDGCPFCETSLPALDALCQRESTRGLAGIAVYHPKPPRAVDDATVLAHAERLGWHGNVRVDADWSALRALLDGRETGATSVSVLLDRQGRARWFHPGPELHPSADPAHAQCAADFAELERVLAVVLAE